MLARLLFIFTISSQSIAASEYCYDQIKDVFSSENLAACEFASNSETNCYVYLSKYSSKSEAEVLASCKGITKQKLAELKNK